MKIAQEDLRIAKKIAKKFYRYWKYTHSYEELLAESYWGLIMAYIRKENGKLDKAKLEYADKPFDWDIYVGYRCKRAIRDYLRNIAKFKHAHELNQIDEAMAKVKVTILDGFLDFLDNDLEAFYIQSLMRGLNDEQFRAQFEFISIHTFYNLKECVMAKLKNFLVIEKE